MKKLDWMVLGSVVLMAGCAADAHDDPVPAPLPNGICAAEHVETEGDDRIVVCDELHAEAPFVRLPEGLGWVFASIESTYQDGTQNVSFVTANGTRYPYGAAFSGDDSEMTRHANTIYVLTIEGGKVKRFRPAVTFPEAMFLAPFMGKAYEGTVSRMTGEGQWAEETSLPVRVQILPERVEAPSVAPTKYQAKVAITNLDAAVTAADGSCMPALSSYGAEAPFPAGETIDLRAYRYPSMHGLGDDQFIFTFEGNGAVRGSLMGSSWFRGPGDLLRGTTTPSGTYTGHGYSAPGYMPNLTLELAEGGGEPCAP
jgi:hypothetical protein